jgi:uncharacterized RDD family membrane protein YckC
MSDAGRGAPPGWYYAPGDPPATQRWWDGHQWIGGPMPVGPPPTHAGGRVLHDLNRTLADPGKRIVARIIDALIIGAVYGLVALIWATGPSGLDTGDIERIGLVLALPALLYEVGFIAVKGATPGKMLMGIRVITQRGVDPPGWGPAFLRYVVNLVGIIPGVGGIASFVILIVSFVFLFTDERRRTVPDRIASTYVVNKR